jgi:replicative DNA helicase
MNFREAPASTEVEKHVIGGAFLFPESLSLVLERLQPEDFYLERHAVIFEAMRDLQTSGAAFGLQGLSHYLAAAGRLESAGGDGYIMEISAEVVSDAGMEHHIGIVKDLAARRRLIRALTQNLESAYDLTKTTLEVQEKAEADVLAVAESQRQGPQLKSMGAVLRVAAQEWQDVANGKPGGLMSKIQPVDNLLLGFRPGKVYILAARPGLGKSMLALQVATQCGETVASYSQEMLATEQAERMISQVSDLNADSLRSANILLAQGPALAAAVEKLRTLKIWFCDENPITPAQILSQCRRLKKKRGLGLIVVDYLQLIKGIGKFERRDLEVGQISKFLKSIAMKLEVPVLCIASLSRKPEERTDKRPLLSDLRESGDIESDADVVMFLYRESDYNPQAKKDFPAVTELIVAKNRGGKKGRSILNFDGAHSKFYGLLESEQDRYLRFLEGKLTEAKSTSNKDKQTGEDFYRGIR